MRSLIPTLHCHLFCQIMIFLSNFIVTSVFQINVFKGILNDQSYCKQHLHTNDLCVIRCGPFDATNVSKLLIEQSEERIVLTNQKMLRSIRSIKWPLTHHYILLHRVPLHTITIAHCQSQLLLRREFFFSTVISCDCAQVARVPLIYILLHQYLTHVFV